MKSTPQKPNKPQTKPHIQNPNKQKPKQANKNHHQQANMNKQNQPARERISR